MPQSSVRSRIVILSSGFFSISFFRDSSNICFVLLFMKSLLSNRISTGHRYCEQQQYKAILQHFYRKVYYQILENMIGIYKRLTNIVFYVVQKCKKIKFLKSILYTSRNY